MYSRLAENKIPIAVIHKSLKVCVSQFHSSDSGDHWFVIILSHHAHFCGIFASHHSGYLLTKDSPAQDSQKGPYMGLIFIAIQEDTGKRVFSHEINEKVVLRDSIGKYNILISNGSNIVSMESSQKSLTSWNSTIRFICNLFQMHVKSAGPYWIIVFFLL